MNKEGQWVEGSISNAGRVVWADSDIIWADWLFCHILNNDEWDSEELSKHCKSG